MLNASQNLLNFTIGSKQDQINVMHKPIFINLLPVLNFFKTLCNETITLFSRP